MNRNHLINEYPNLYHMAEIDSWDSIKEHGLLSTSALLDLYGYDGEIRNKLERYWRPKRYCLQAKGLPNAYLRDQKPMPPDSLNDCLVDMEVEDWYFQINQMTFFWVKWKPSVIWFLGAREYRNKKHIIIEVNTDSLLSAHYDEVYLSSINSGSTLSDNPKPRGDFTFTQIKDYDTPWVTEFAVIGGVPDIVDHVISVSEWISQFGKCQKIRDVYP